jgi:hypothetical protein
MGLPVKLFEIGGRTSDASKLWMAEPIKIPCDTVQCAR